VAGLAERRALVTGAGRGIGRAIAEALARQGCRLLLVGRDATALQQTAAICRHAGAALTEISPRDLTERGALAGLCRGAGEIDILVNNAGSAPSAPFERTDDALWDATFALNVHAPFALCRALLPGMAERGFGRVVNLASTAALQGFPYTAAYVASKHALLGLTRALAAEVVQRHAGADRTVNAVCPGFTDTDLVAASAVRIARATGCSEEEAKARLGRMNPGGRLHAPGDVAAAVLALIAELPGATQGAAVELDRAAR